MDTTFFNTVDCHIRKAPKRGPYVNAAGQWLVGSGVWSFYLKCRLRTPFSVYVLHMWL